MGSGVSGSGVRECSRESQESAPSHPLLNRPDSTRGSRGGRSVEGGCELLLGTAGVVVLSGICAWGPARDRYGAQADRCRGAESWDEAKGKAR